MTIGNPTTRGQANVPAMRTGQQTVGHVLTEMGSGRRWREGQEGHWQATHPRWKQMIAASCHVVFVAQWKIRTTSLELLAGPHYPIISEVSH